LNYLLFGSRLIFLNGVNITDAKVEKSGSGLQFWKKYVFCGWRLFAIRSEVSKAGKTSNSHSSAYMDPVEGELRSKSKCLAQQVYYTSSVKNQRFLPPSPQGEGFYALLTAKILHFDGWRLS
jgi:hypothetical protein